MKDIQLTQIARYFNVQQVLGPIWINNLTKRLSYKRLYTSYFCNKRKNKVKLFSYKLS